MLPRDRWSLAAIATGALGLRLWGIGFGLPRLYHPDEPAYVLQALAVARGLPNGLTFADPPLFKYLLLAEDAATYVAARLTGVTGSPAAFVEQFRQDPSPLYLLARGTSAGPPPRWQQQSAAGARALLQPSSAQRRISWCATRISGSTTCS
jgi:hypothetical protein